MGEFFGPIIDLFKEIFFWFIPWVIISEYEEAVLLRFGRYKKTLKPGFHWVWPFAIDHIIPVHTSTETIPTRPQSLTTADSQNIIVSAKIKCRIQDVRKYIIDVKDVTNAVEDIAQAKIKQLVMESTWEQCRDSSFDQKVTERLRREADKWGVYIERVTTADLQLTLSIRLIQ